jgi:hypothetical protein
MPFCIPNCITVATTKFVYTTEQLWSLKTVITRFNSLTVPLSFSSLLVMKMRTKEDPHFKVKPLRLLYNIQSVSFQHIVTHPAVDRPVFIWILIFWRNKDMVLEVDVCVDIFTTAAATRHTDLSNNKWNHYLKQAMMLLSRFPVRPRLENLDFQTPFPLYELGSTAPRLHMHRILQRSTLVFPPADGELTNSWQTIMAAFHVQY